MKTLIKKNLYYKNASGVDHSYKRGSRFMGGVGINGGGASAGSPASTASGHVEYINIGHPGDAIDWGGELLSSTLFNMGVGSDGHRGLLSGW